jgi:Uma2 family endonuclease
MAKLLQRAATYADLQNVPEHLVAELIDGELFTSPRPATRHARANLRLAARIHRAFDEGDGGPGGWWIIGEPELHLGADVLVPDIAGWRREHVPEFPDVVAVDIAPDWICEVASPSTMRLDRFKKLPKYAESGVEHVWLVDPNNRTLEFFRRSGSRYDVIAAFDDEEPVVRAEPFDAIEFSLSTLWPPAPLS